MIREVKLTAEFLIERIRYLEEKRVNNTEKPCMKYDFRSLEHALELNKYILLKLFNVKIA